MHRIDALEKRLGLLTHGPPLKRLDELEAQLEAELRGEGPIKCIRSRIERLETQFGLADF